MADTESCKQNRCSTRLAVYCKPEDRDAIMAAIPQSPDECLPGRLCYGVCEDTCFDGQYDTLNGQLQATALAVWDQLDAMVLLAERYEISYRLEAYCDFLWRPCVQNGQYASEVDELLLRLGAELDVEVKWEDDMMWRCGLPQRHMPPAKEGDEPRFEEIESMEELLEI